MYNIVNKLVDITSNRLDYDYDDGNIIIAIDITGIIKVTNSSH